MAQVEIVSEREDGRGWVLSAQVLDDGGELRRCEVALSWADYNLWSGSGADTPEEVAEAVLRFLLGRVEPGDLKASFDASLARRMFADADEAIPRLIHDQR